MILTCWCWCAWKRNTFETHVSWHTFPRSGLGLYQPKENQSRHCSRRWSCLPILYKAPPWVSLDLLKFQYFHQTVLFSKSFVDPQVLSPTSAAAKFHSLRTYFQVQQWMSLHTNFRPEDWSWKIDGGQYLNILTKRWASRNGEVHLQDWLFIQMVHLQKTWHGMLICLWMPWCLLQSNKSDRLWRWWCF